MSASSPKSPFGPGQQHPAWTGPPSNASSGGAVVVMIIALGVVILLGLACAGAAVGFLFFARSSASMETVQMQQDSMAIEVAPVEPVLAELPSASTEAIPPDPSRAVWLYPASPEGASGALRQQDAENWLETRSDNVTYQFHEVARTDEFVELYDESRQLYVRLYGDRMEWRRGEEWLPGQGGAWQAAATDAPRP